MKFLRNTYKSIKLQHGLNLQSCLSVYLTEGLADRFTMRSSNLQSCLSVYLPVGMVDRFTMPSSNLQFTMRSFKFTIYNCIIKFIFLVICFMPLFLFAQNAVTKQGESTASGTGFVDHNGRIVGYTALTRNGEILFPCEAPITDGRDGNVYSIVRIGNQCWMAENLRYLPSVVGPGTGSTSPLYYYVYGYNGISVPDAKATSNYSTYGVLYNFLAATNNDWFGSSTNPSGIQGACPDGWHLPSDAEWIQLKNYLSANPTYWCGGNSTSIAKSLASTTGWTASATNCQVGNNTISNNTTGFNALPGGRRISSTFELINNRAQFWSATHASGSWSLNYIMDYNSFNIYQNHLDKANGYSVRCIRNDCEHLTVPITGSHITTSNQIEWNWNAVPHATGYKYNTTNNYASAVDLGNTTTFTQSGLFCGTNYTLYVWAYSLCTNSTPATLTASSTACPANPCGGMTQFVDSRDGNIYNTVEIGGQCWMKENLAYLPSVVGSSTTSYTIPYYYVYGYNGTSVPTAKATANYINYGVLYNWPAIMNGAGSSNNNPSGVQGVCPTGWHVPSLEEQYQFDLFLRSNAIYWCDGWHNQISKSLANTSGWTVSSNNCATGNDQISNNVSGFSAKPSGLLYSSFQNINSNAYFWSSTEDNMNNAAISAINYNHPQFFTAIGTAQISPHDKNSGISLRCVKD